MKSDLDQRLDELLQGHTPSLELEFWRGNQRLYHYRYGKHYSSYDLASLTKILFTVTTCMDLVQQDILQVKTPVKKILPWFGHAETRVYDLLTHSSGLPWWLPFYEDFDETDSVEERRWKLKHRIRRTSVKKTERAVYSDVGFLLLGMVLEELMQKPLLEIWQEIKQRHYSSLGLHFNPAPSLATTDYAPTRRSRKRRRGEVDDDNCQALGGVSSHAGLFGSCRDVSRAGRYLLNSYHRGSPELSREVVQSFARRALPRTKGDWGLGFMLPTAGAASCGKYFSSTAYGHLGFTGCSLWMDPSQDWLMSIVSNRVYLSQDRNFSQLRAAIHDLVIEELGVH